jgi:hypothetical protein
MLFLWQAALTFLILRSAEQGESEASRLGRVSYALSEAVERFDAATWERLGQFAPLVTQETLPVLPQAEQPVDTQGRPVDTQGRPASFQQAPYLAVVPPVAPAGPPATPAPAPVHKRSLAETETCPYYAAAMAAQAEVQHLPQPQPVPQTSQQVASSTPVVAPKVETRRVVNGASWGRPPAVPSGIPPQPMSFRRRYR